MSRNYGIGTRDMQCAGQLILNRAVSRRELSFSSAATITDRWKVFVDFAKDHQIGRMERITPELVVAYGKDLATQVYQGGKSSAYAQNLVSAVNTVLGLVRRDWKSISPTKECGVPNRCAIRQSPPAGCKPETSSAAIETLRAAKLHRAAAIAELAQVLGLRSKEAALLNTSRAYTQAIKQGMITVEAGTKGGRQRVVPIMSTSQLESLQRAAGLQGCESCLIPSNQNWKTFRNRELRAGRVILKAFGITGYHDQRAVYACSRYQVLTGKNAPVFGQPNQDKEQDLRAREQISAELGHERIDVISEYIGGRD